MKTTLFIVLLWSPLAMAWKIQVSSPQTVTPLLELYTSEGCSSCPPADKFLAKLSETLDLQQVTAMALHVDCWNYLGWEDPFSKPAYTQRQRLLGQLNKQRTIYTPEFFVNGEETRGTRQVLRRIQDLSEQAAELRLALTVESLEPRQVKLLATAEWLDHAQQQDLQWIVVWLQNDIQRKIGAGENRGETLQHERVVREWLGPFRGQQIQQVLEVPADASLDDSQIAVLAFGENGLEYLQSLQVELQQP